eukprot:366331-Chlamydomonas_euryale.AAC.4
MAPAAPSASARAPAAAAAAAAAAEAAAEAEATAPPKVPPPRWAAPCGRGRCCSLDSRHGALVSEQSQRGLGCVVRVAPMMSCVLSTEV